MLKEKMEILIFGLIASYHAHRQQEPVIGEPEEFQPFDLQALSNSADNKPSRRVVDGRHTCHKPSNFFDYGLKS